MASTDADLATSPPRLAAPANAARTIQRFIQTAVSGADADGAVVNLSGGIDSTLTATLATRALGSDRVTGLILPATINADENMDDAVHVAEELVIDHAVIPIQDVLDAFITSATTRTVDLESDPMTDSTARATVPTKRRKHYTEAVGNAAARLRMCHAYFEANTTDSIVLGTGNRTELELGYFTKHGDGAADVLPIGPLFKSEVRQLAAHVDVADRIIEKEPTAGLWAGQADEVELGATYERIDTILWNLLEVGASTAAIAEAVDCERETVERFARMRADADHKRTPPPAPDGFDRC